MAFEKCIAIVTVFALLLAATPTWTAPTRTSSTSSGRTDSSGSASGSGENCNAELSSSEIQSLRTQINDATSSLSGIIQRVHVWPLNGVRATVGIYTSSILMSDDPAEMARSDYGHALAASVAHLYAFIRPLGDVLTNETVREVIDMEDGFAEEFSDALTKVGDVATKMYELVKGDWTIHECILPNLPIDTYTSLNPQPPLNSRVENPSDRDVIVDGIASELASLTADIEDAMRHYYSYGE